MQHTLLNATSLIFIDAHLEEIDTLCANLPHDAEIQLLNSEENLLIQIAAQLKNRNDIAALHLITHGRSGELLLGDNGVFLETLPLYGKELLAITQAMSSEGEILIYGCEVAFGERGSAFVEMLRDITGLKIAASTHKVGSSELGGSWELDNAHVNSIVSPLVVSEFKGVLDPSPDTTAPVITSTPITTVDEGSRYNYALAATDDNTVTWSVKGGTALPSWLSLGKGESLTTLVPDFSDPGGMAYNEVTGDIYATANSFLSFMMEVATESFIWKISPNGDKALFTTSVSGQIGSMVIVGDYLYAENLSLGSGIAGEIVRYDLSDTDGAVTPEVLLSLDSPGIYSAGALGLAAHGSFLYAVDYANSKILKIDLANLTAEPMVYLDLGLQNKSQPYGIAFDAAGNLYGTLLGAQEGGVGEVYKFDGTNFSIVMSDTGGGAALHGKPTDIKIDADGNFYVSHFLMLESSGIYKYASDFTEVAEISATANTWSMIINNDGLIVAGDLLISEDFSIGGEIFKIDTLNYALSGTPDSSASGEYLITLIATDADSNATEHTFTITVNDVPESQAAPVIDLFTGNGGEGTNNFTGESYDYNLVPFTNGASPISDADSTELQSLKISIPTAQLTRESYTEYLTDGGGDWDIQIDLNLNYVGSYTTPDGNITFDLQSSVIDNNCVITFTGQNGNAESVAAFNELLSLLHYRYNNGKVIQGGLESHQRTFSITAVDAEGNETTTPATFTVAPGADTVAPEFDGEEGNPSDGATDVSVNGDNGYLSFGFTEDVTLVNDKTITLYKTDGNVLVKTFATGDGELFEVDGSNVYIDLGNFMLDYATDYYVKIDAGAFIDEAGNEFAGITDATTWNFSTMAKPDGIWTPVGETFGTSWGSSDLEFSGTTPFVLFDTQDADWNNVLTVKTLDNTGNWVTVGNEGFITANQSTSDLEIGPDGKPYVVSYESGF